MIPALIATATAAVTIAVLSDDDSDKPERHEDKRVEQTTRHFVSDKYVRDKMKTLGRPIRMG